MIIKSSTSLCDNYDEFSFLAHNTGEPIYITKDGEGDLVLMSIAAYEKLQNLSFAAFNPSLSNHKEIRRKSDIMSEFTLGNVLKKLYNDAPRGYQVATIHIFAIHYADVIEKKRLNKKEILRNADLPDSYQTELSKGINLAQYVDLKESTSLHITEIEKQFL